MGHSRRDFGEWNPALTFPILPPSLSGLTALVIRPQHGPPVLPPHSAKATPAEAATTGRLRVLADRHRVVVRARRSQHVQSPALLRTCRCRPRCCLYRNKSELGGDRTGGESRVQLVPARSPPGVDERGMAGATTNRARRRVCAGFHHRARTHHRPGCASACGRSFPGTRRLHFVHMAPDEIEWHKLDREAAAGIRAKSARDRSLSLAEARTGRRRRPRLHDRYARDLHPAPSPIRFDPGFERD